MKYLPIVILHHLRVLSRGNLLQLEPSLALLLPASPEVGTVWQQIAYHHGGIAHAL